MLSVLIKNPQTKETFVHLTMSHKGTPSLDFSAQKRSYGSLLKPLLLGFLLEEGFSENTGILDTEYQYSLPNGESYRPQNYGLKSGGFLTLKEAVASSFNQSSVLAVSYNLPKFFQFLENLGAQFSKTQENIGLSVILGGGELSLQNIVTLYENFLISSRIKTETKKSVFLALKDEKLREKGFRNRLRTPSFLQFAVKTGTASYFTDNTLIAFRPDLIIGISLGNNTGTPLHNIDGVSGTESLFQELAMYALQNGFSQKHEWDRDTALNILPVCLEDFLFPELTYKKILEKKEYQNTVSFCDEKNIPQKVYQFLPDTSVIIQKKDIARELQKIPFSFSDTGTFTLNEKIYENFTQGFFDLPFGKSSYSHETEFGVIEGEIEVRGEW
jgi:membrane carboxypeptidase/penicillin-binding protein PbpC